MGPDMDALAEKLGDERSRRVVFVAHCILNENTIYQGGAFRQGAVDEVVDRLRGAGVGIVQMPCPEQRAWGGVRKRTMWLALDSDEQFPGLMSWLVPLFTWYTRHAYGKIAKAVAREIEDYVDSGFEVAGIIGIKGSPSCGVRTTLDLNKASAYLADHNVWDLRREEFNERGIKGCWVEGSGLYVAALKRELKKRGLDVAFSEHDHFSELP